MTTQQIYARNEEWIPTVGVLLRAILYDYRQTTGINTLRCRMEKGAGVGNSFYTVPNPAGGNFTPSANAIAKYQELRQFHQANYDGGVTLRFGTAETIDLIPGRTYTMPLQSGASNQGSPSPGPYSDPDPYPVPPYCIPCIEPVMIA